MSAVKPSDFPLLLEVFRDGLKCGIVSKDEIVAWADEIILNEDEPDYFFIELSLGRDVNSLLEILNKNFGQTESPIVFRALMGFFYRKLTDDNNTITSEEAAVLIGNSNNFEILSGFESNQAYTFDDYDLYYPSDYDQLKTDIVNFLSIYEDFSFNNYNLWHEINFEIEIILNEKQLIADAKYAALTKTWQKNQRIRKLKRNLFLGLLAMLLLGMIIANFKIIANEPKLSDLFYNHNNLFFLDFFSVYFLIRVSYKIWRKKRRTH